MKKLISTLLITSLLLISCSKTEQSSNTNPGNKVDNAVQNTSLTPEETGNF